jgi:hypothetical protein
MLVTNSKKSLMPMKFYLTPRKEKSMINMVRKDSAVKVDLVE